MTAKTKRFLSACIALLMAFTAMNMAFVQANAAEECTHSKVWKIDYEATEDHDGQMSFYCTKCNEVFESKKFTRHAHTEGYKKVMIAPYCETEGMGGIVCATCNAVYETYAIDALGHTTYKSSNGTTEIVSKNNKLDLVFVVDTTGSMGGDISQVKSDMVSYLDVLATTGMDYRVAIVDYRDYPERSGTSDDYPYAVQLDFTAVTGTILSGISALSLGDGGDGAETIYSALTDGLEELSWREDAGKAVILMGDANALDPEPISGYTLDTTIEKIKNAYSTPITVFAIACSTGESTVNNFRAIAEGTGGQLYTSTMSVDLTAIITEIIEIIPDVIVIPEAETWVVTLAPSCRTTGQRTCYCSRCGKVIATEEIPALGHTDTTSETPIGGSNEIVFLIDESGSMSWSDPDGIRKDAAKKLSDAMSADDKAAVVAFDHSTRLLTDFTSDKTVINNAIDQAGENGGTDMYNGLSVCFDLFSGTSSANRVIVLLTDGDSEYSSFDYETAAKNKNVKIYTVGLGAGVNEQDLRAIADLTGGKYYFADIAEDLLEIYEGLAEVVVNSGGTWITTIVPTCSTEGEKVCLCDRCGEAIASKPIPASSHQYDVCVYTNTESHTGTCVNCGKTASSLHCWSEWSFNGDNTFFSNGTKTRICLDCNAKETVKAKHTSIFGRIFYPVYAFFLRLFNRIPIRSVNDAAQAMGFIY